MNPQENIDIAILTNELEKNHTANLDSQTTYLQDHLQYLKPTLSQAELLALTAEDDQLMNEDGEPPKVDDTKLG